MIFSCNSTPMSDIPRNDVTKCIILSGGSSSRMKSPKALLRFSDCRNFLQQIIGEYQKAGIEQIVVVRNSNIKFTGINAIDSNICVVENNDPQRGRLFSIQLGLKAAFLSDYCFIQNIDNPFVTSELIRSLYKLRTRAEYIAPEFEAAGGHPVLLSGPAIKEILSLTDYTSTLKDILKHYSRHRLITTDADCIKNINDPSDYEKHILSKTKIQPIL